MFNKEQNYHVNIPSARIVFWTGWLKPQIVQIAVKMPNITFVMVKNSRYNKKNTLLIIMLTTLVKMMMVQTV
jgi:hypothetical protein